MQKLRAVVMAGGEGSRLRPITANRPKPLVPVGNEPIMLHILKLLRRHEIEDVVVTLHYLADEIQSYFDDGEEFGVRLHYSIEDTPLGTAGSVKKAEELLRDGPFVIISGDALTDCDLQKAYEFHKSKGSVATLVLARVSNPLEFGVVITDESGKVQRFLEKPSWSEVFSDTVNTGIYILEPEILDLMVPGKQYDWSQDIFPELLRNGAPMYGYVMEDYWSDIGNLQQYREAQEHLLSGRAHLPVAGEEVRPGVWYGDHVSVDEGATIIPPVVIGRNTKVKFGARIGPHTVIGENCLVEEDAVVERSVVWEGTYLGPNVAVHSAIIGSRVTIKRDSVVREDAVVGDRCLIDIGSTIQTRIKLWPDKVIERGSTVTMSLVWGNKWRGNLFRELGVAGLSNIEITPEFATRLGSAFGSTLPDRATVVMVRDSSRASRMIKRAMTASLLSVGCEIVDMQSMAVPVARHYIRASGSAGAANVRRMPDNPRLTVVELLDSRGNYLSKNQERKVESAFFREDFHRIDPEDLGVIEYASHAVEEYQSDFLRRLKKPSGGRPLRLVCDLGFTSVSNFFPQMAGDIGIETININAYNDSRRSPRTKQDLQRHIENLQYVVRTLGYDFGVLIYNEAERLIVIDSSGHALDGPQLLAAIALLTARMNPKAQIALNVTASDRLESQIKQLGGTVVRTKADTRSLMDAAMTSETTLAGDGNGGFIFPELHPGFDAMYAFASLVTLLQTSDVSLAEVVKDLPRFHLAYDKVRCPWESKGTVMRILTEQSANHGRVDLLDGIKVYDDSAWALVLPDSYEPVFHIYAESDGEDRSHQLVEDYARRITELQAQLP